MRRSQGADFDNVGIESFRFFGKRLSGNDPANDHKNYDEKYVQLHHAFHFGLLSKGELYCSQETNAGS